MTPKQALRIIKDEIVIDSRGVYRAIEKENNKKQCAINRMRRLKALNKFIGNETGEFPYLNWLPVAQEENDYEEGYLCICGHPISTSHVLIYKPKPDIQIAHGSECIKRVRTEFVDCPEATEFVNSFKTDIAKQKRTCPTCRGTKLVKHEYCGDTECKLTKLRREQELEKERRHKQEKEQKKKQEKQKTRWFFHFSMEEPLI